MTKLTGMAELIRPSTVLPAIRTPISFLTSDGLKLIGEVASPSNGDLSIGLLCLHPLPTHGGMMDSHIFKKAANRLPEMAGITVIRFNTRGTESEQGKSEGSFGNAVTEKEDVIAAVNYSFEVVGVKSLWVVGWSFGTDLALKYAIDPRIKGLILLSPPLRFSTEEDLQFWNQDSRRILALVPEFDDYLKPAEARLRFAPLRQTEIVSVEDAKLLGVGDPFVYRSRGVIVKG